MPHLRFAAPSERRAALVTGGARGIGAAAAVRLAEAGRDIVIADLLASESADTVGQIEALGQAALFVATDVRDQAAVRAAVAATMERFGRLDILVCCAGVLGAEKPFLEQSAAEFEDVMRINVHGVYHAHQAAVPHMLERGWGRTVTITSSARRGTPNVTPYAVSKGAVYSLIGSLGSAWADQNVFVNGVEPGRVLTEMVVPRFTPEFLADPGVPLGRYADASELAEIIEMLCSERNTYTTGAVWSMRGKGG